MRVFSYLLMSGITTGALYALVALGVVVLYKAAAVINFAHGEQFALAAYFAYTFHIMLGFPYLPALVLAVLGAVIVGILAYKVGFQPVAREGMVSVLLATLGLSFILKGGARYVWGGKGEVLSFPPMLATEPVRVLGIMVLVQQLVVVGAVVVVMALFAIFFTHTRMGKWMQATANNPKAARLVGIRVDAVYRYGFIIAGAAAGVAAVLMAPLILLYPDMGFIVFVKGFAAAILGGLRNIRGAVLGGLLIGIAEQMGGGYIHTSLQEISAFVVIMVVLVFLPTGVFGVRHVRKA